MVARMVNRFRQGQHICALFEGDEEMLAIASSYLEEGLRCGEQVMFAPGMTWRLSCALWTAACAVTTVT